MLGTLAAVVDEVIFTKVEMERSADPQVLAEKFSERIPHRVISDSRAALRALMQEADEQDVIVVAGSLYLLGEVRPMLEEITIAKAANSRAADSQL